MFQGFSEGTLEFFLDLKFHNSTEYFHSQHERYLREVQAPFYEMIGELGPLMQKIDPRMEIRPYKCLSHIHRDTRFTKDKSPYRDHLWFLFRKAAEPRDKSLFYYFEFGPQRLSWGMGFWGENREAMDQFRRRMAARPDEIAPAIEAFERNRRHLALGGTIHKRIAIPENIPERMKRWYVIKEMYIGKTESDGKKVFSRAILDEVAGDFKYLAPMYQMFSGCIPQ